MTRIQKNRLGKARKHACARKIRRMDKYLIERDPTYKPQLTGSWRV